MKIYDLSPPTVNSLMKISCFVAIFHALLLVIMGKNREISLYCGSLSTLSVF